MNRDINLVGYLVMNFRWTTKAAQSRPRLDGHHDKLTGLWWYAPYCVRVSVCSEHYIKVGKRTYKE